MEMEGFCSDFVVMETFLSSTLEALVVEVSVAVTLSLGCLLLTMGDVPNGIKDFHMEARQLERLQIADPCLEKQPPCKNEDGSGAEDDDEDNDDEKDNPGDDAGDGEEFSGGEDNGEDEGDLEEEPQANGDGENGEDDDEDDSDDEDGEEEEDEEEEEEAEEEEEEEVEEEENDEEICPPPAKKRK